MAKYRVRPIEVEAITFDELVEHGRNEYKRHGYPLNDDNMPHSFEYKGYKITNECFFIETLTKDIKFNRGDILAIDEKGRICVYTPGIFEDTCEPIKEDE